MKGLTERQLQVVTFIKSFTEEYKYPPTVQEIASNFKITIRSVQDHLIALQKKGAISSSEKRCRSIRVLLDADLASKDNAVTYKVPVIGTLKEGTPLLSDCNIDGFINLGEPFVSEKKQYFALHITTDDYKSYGILAGDYALIEQTCIVSDGQIICVRDENEVKLIAFNKLKDNIHIEGVLSNIIRSY